MKIPEYIRKKLYERMRVGLKLNALDCEIHEWMQKKGIEKDTSFLSDDEFSLISLNTILLVTEPITLMHQTARFIEKGGDKNDR